MKNDCQSDRNKGFTLIELLVVIAIIALLLSILAPGLQRARQLAQRAVCLSNSHQWAIGIRMYAADFDSFFPTYHNQGEMPTAVIVMNRYFAVSGNSSGTFPHDLVSSFFIPYLPSHSVVWCPDIPAGFRNAGQLRKESFESLRDRIASGEEIYGSGFSRQMIGDYVYFVGQDYNKAAIKNRLWRLPGSSHPYYIPPMRTTNAPSSMAVMGDTVKGGFTGPSEFHHPWTHSTMGLNMRDVRPRGMVAAFNDGSSRWVEYNNLVRHTVYSSSDGYTFLWPNPLGREIGPAWD